MEGALSIVVNYIIKYHKVGNMTDYIYFTVVKFGFAPTCLGLRLSRIKIDLNKVMS